MPVDLAKLGILFPGGGSRGIVQLGMAQAYKDLNLPKPSMTAGVSVGSLNAALIHQGDLELLHEVWANISTRNVYRWAKPHKLFTSYAAIYDNTPLENLIRSVINYEKIKANPIPFFLNVTDLSLRRSLVMESGDFIDEEEFIQFLKASASPPVFFPPTNFRGTPVGDGGVVNNFNIDVARDQGCDTIIVFYPSNPPPDQKIDNILEMLGVVMTAPSEADKYRQVGYINKVNQIIEIANINLEPDIRKIRLLFIAPNRQINTPTLDFDYKRSMYDRKSLYQIGYESAMQALVGLCL